MNSKPVFASFAVCLVYGFAGLSSANADHHEGVEPLPAAHAHNDYEHQRPLHDALSKGFCSIEADIHLQDGELLVGHDREDLRPERTLEALYLKPLAERVQENSGRVYKGGPSIVLLVDIKTDADSTYKALRPLLDKYRRMLTSYSPGIVNRKAVTVILSGNRPFEMVKAEKKRLAGIDGRVEDLFAQEDKSSELVPLVSDHWGRHFRFTGAGEMSAEDQKKLDRIVLQAHRQGRKVRFWATPEDERLWAKLREAGVDYIGTDELGRLAKFLSQNE